jgi:hypothetical protein
MNAAEESWAAVLRDKAQEISLIASWASIVGYQGVADKLRSARYDLLETIKFREELFGDRAERSLTSKTER